MQRLTLAACLIAAVAAAAAASDVNWAISGTPQVQRGQPVQFQIAVQVTEDCQGLAGYVFDLAVGPAPGPGAGPDGLWETADDENIADVQIPALDWAAVFRVQGGAGTASVKDGGLAGGPGLGIFPSAGTNSIKSGELIQVGAGVLTWTPFTPGNEGQTAGVGLASRKASLLANSSGDYVLHTGTIPTTNLAGGTYILTLIPLRARVLRPDLQFTQAQPGLTMMPASGVGASLQFEVTEVYVAADFDRDGDVDLGDYMHFAQCATGSLVLSSNPNCQNADLDGDGAIDMLDFGIFQRCYSGAGLRPNPSCAN